MKKIYLTIPESYKNVYDALVKKMDDYGTDLIEDCSTDCSSKSKNLISCWNMFQAACCSFTRNNYKKSDFLINYINKKLALGFDKIETTEGFDKLITFETPGISVSSSGLSSLTRYIFKDDYIVNNLVYTKINIYNNEAIDKYSGVVNNTLEGRKDCIYYDNNNKEFVSYIGEKQTYKITNDIINNAISNPSDEYNLYEPINITVGSNIYEVYVEPFEDGYYLKSLSKNQYISATSSRLYFTASKPTIDYITVSKNANIQWTKNVDVYKPVYVKLSIVDGNIFINAFDETYNKIGYIRYYGTLPSIKDLNLKNYIVTNEKINAYVVTNFCTKIEGDDNPIIIPFTLEDNTVKHLTFKCDAEWIDVERDWFNGESKNNIIINYLEINDNLYSRKCKITIYHEGEEIGNQIIIQEANENNDWN